MLCAAEPRSVGLSGLCSKKLATQLIQDDVSRRMGEGERMGRWPRPIGLSFCQGQRRPIPCQHLAEVKPTNRNLSFSRVRGLGDDPSATGEIVANGMPFGIPQAR